MKLIDIQKSDVEAVKYAMRSMPYLGISIQELLKKIIYNYKEYYEIENDSRFLQAAMLHILAYLELGFCYEDNRVLFDYFMDKCESFKQELLSNKSLFSKKVKLNKSQVRKMIRRWPASRYHDMNINEVVNDIIDKVKGKKEGVYYYDGNTKNKGDQRNLYELIVGETIVFHDIGENKYYTFEEY